MHFVRNRDLIEAAEKAQAELNREAAQRAREAMLSSDSTLPWMGSRHGFHYFRNAEGCEAARMTQPAHRVYFKDVADATNYGRSRLVDKGC
jgi:hypothetical protein